jgi:hypothetical protein
MRCGCRRYPDGVGIVATHLGVDGGSVLTQATDGGCLAQPCGGTILGGDPVEVGSRALAVSSDSGTLCMLVMCPRGNHNNSD